MHRDRRLGSKSRVRPLLVVIGDPCRDPDPRIGKARASELTAEQRAEITRKADQKRWGKPQS